MAEGRLYVCHACRAQVDAWSDGNPYLIDEAGERKYVYHPDDAVDDCVGNDVPHLCLACSFEFMVDSRAPTVTCPSCQSAEICPTFQLAGRRCPFCKAGKFVYDPSLQAIP
jgi:DNA-directed RNA polymerase subunit RPC12/RpoP